MRVAVTGGTGFIGRRLVLRHLEAGDSVRVLSRFPETVGLPDAVRLFPGDLSDGSTELSSFVDGADVLYHCASELRDTLRMRQVHVVGTQHLLRAAAGKIGRWVQLSSVGVYGPVRSGIITEESPVRPVGEYEITKWEADRLLSEEVARGFNATILRPSNVFGPDMKSQGLLRLTTLIKKGMFFFIGKPGAIANYIHVDNVIEALVLCATKKEARGATYNLSDWRTFEQLVSLVAEELAVPVPRWRIPELLARGVAWPLSRVCNFPLNPARIDHLVGRAIYDESRIERELGYRHPVGFELALKRTVRAWHGDAHGDASLSSFEQRRRSLGAHRVE